MKTERQKANIELLNILSEIIYTYPDLRFSQILINYDFLKNTKSDFYKESNITLDDVMQVLHGFKDKKGK